MVCIQCPRWEWLRSHEYICSFVISEADASVLLADAKGRQLGRSSSVGVKSLSSGYPLSTAVSEIAETDGEALGARVLEDGRPMAARDVPVRAALDERNRGIDDCKPGSFW